MFMQASDQALFLKRYDKSHFALGVSETDDTAAAESAGESIVADLVNAKWTSLHASRPAVRRHSLRRDRPQHPKLVQQLHRSHLESNCRALDDSRRMRGFGRHLSDRDDTVTDSIYSCAQTQGRLTHSAGRRYMESHEGDKPIAVTWRLENALPAGLYRRYATLAQG